MELPALATYIRKLWGPDSFLMSLLHRLEGGLEAAFYCVAFRIAPHWIARRSLEKTSEELSQAARLLPEISSRIGEKFLHSEQLLEDLTQASAQLLADSQELLGLASGQNQGHAIVDETRTLLAAPLAYLDLWQRDLAGQLDRLAAARGMIRGVLACEEELQRCVLPLRFIQSMFRMESAQLPEGVRQVFSSLTGRIDEIETEVRETLSRQFRTISGTSETIDRVVAKVTALAQQVEQTVLSRRREVSELLSGLTAEIQKNHGRQIQLITNSQEISTQTGRLVVALQVHDIISQKMEHVRSSLSTCVEAIDAMGESLPAADLRDGISRTGGILEIQSAQTASIDQDIRDAEKSLHDATGKINLQAKSLDSDCLLLKEYSQVTGAANGTVEVLFEIIGDIREVTRKAVSAAHEACELIAPMGGVVTGLTGALERLSHEMRLISLNAQIQAVQIGLGTGLEVLSAHTVDVSLETTRLTSEVSVQLERFTSDIQTILSGFQELARTGDAEVEDFQGKASVQEARLHALRDLMLAKLQAVGGAAEHIGRSTADMSSYESMRQEIESSIAGIGETIGRACRACRKLSSGLRVGELHRSQYTMAAERRTHAAVVARLSPGAEGPEARFVPAASVLTADREASAIELF